jgi:hypothetical protein
MMFAHVPQHVEPAHRFHLYIGDDDLWLNRVHLLDRFRRGIEREDLVPLFPAERHDDLHHCRLVVYDDDLGHDRRAEIISRVRKVKANLRIGSIYKGLAGTPPTSIQLTGSLHAMIFSRRSADLPFTGTAIKSA